MPCLGRKRKLLKREDGRREKESWIREKGMPYCVLPPWTEAGDERLSENGIWCIYTNKLTQQTHANDCTSRRTGNRTETWDLGCLLLLILKVECETQRERARVRHDGKWKMKMISCFSLLLSCFWWSLVFCLLFDWRNMRLKNHRHTTSLAFSLHSVCVPSTNLYLTCRLLLLLLAWVQSLLSPVPSFFPLFFNYTTIKRREKRSLPLKENYVTLNLPTTHCVWAADSMPAASSPGSSRKRGGTS